MPRAQLDPALGIRILGVRELRYDDSVHHDDDRPAHVRAASGLAMVGGRLAVIQDDAAFIGFVGDTVTAVPLPRGAGGRRRFEEALGNKQDKLDLEACVAVDDELWAFGSGSTPMREKIAVIGYTTRLHGASPLYRRLREELSAPSASDSFLVPPTVNIEGACIVDHELWLFHRGNTGPHDAGPTVFKLDKEQFAKWLASDGACPDIDGVAPFELGSVDGVRLGFTDAVAVGPRVFYLAAAECSPNAIDDGEVIGCQLGVIQGDEVRACALEIEGKPLKAEGLAFDPQNPKQGWISIDPDDTEKPAQLFQFELVGPW